MAAKNSTSESLVYKYDDINVKNILISDLKDVDNSKLCYVNYKNTKKDLETKVIIQTGDIKLTSHGVPSKHPTYYPTDDKRLLIKVPLDPEQEECVKLSKFLEKLDNYFGSTETTTKIFGKNAKKYSYKPCVRTPSSEDEDEDENTNSKKKTPRCNYCKMQLNFARDSSEYTSLLRLEKIEGKKIIDVPNKTIDDVHKLVSYLSEIRLLFYITKIWVMKTKFQGASTLLYGIGLKVIAIRCKPKFTSSVDKRNIAFLKDNDEEYEYEDEKTLETSQNGKTVKPTQKLVNSDNEEDIPKMETKVKKTKEPETVDMDKKKSKSKKEEKNENSDNEEDIPKMEAKVKKTKELESVDTDKKKSKSKKEEINEDSDNSDEESSKTTKSKHSKSKKKENKSKKNESSDEEEVTRKSLKKKEESEDSDSDIPIKKK